ncbi:MAG TPA: ATP-binding protein, partial [Desulfosalsimonadaceae bacterium]|nr:ATP-binding protein [Desulfosalsimonadaceae bacterium]
MAMAGTAWGWEETTAAGGIERMGIDSKPETFQAGERRQPDRRRFLRFAPTWQANLLVFGCLIGIVLALVYWQIRSSEKTFVSHVRDHARLLASVIRLQADTAVMSKSAIEAIMQTFLGNTARLVDYLDTIAPFTPDELTAFANESGMAGIAIVTADNEIILGPSGWMPDQKNADEPEPDVLSYKPEKALYSLTLPRPEGGRILVGFQSDRIKRLRRELSLDTLLDTLSAMPEIEYVRLGPADNYAKAKGHSMVGFTNIKDRQIAEARMPFEGKYLLLGLDANFYFNRVNQLWTQFFVIAGILALVGMGLSWGLYRYQAAYLQQIRSFERKLAKEQEDAALGRATAAIAHELRNPLNAISMGLQRLSKETAGLTPAQTELIDALMASVNRSNKLIQDLKQFAGPITPARQAIHPDAVISSQITLYKDNVKKKGISVDYKPTFTGTLMADADLFAIAFENLLKNAVEAQPNGGYIKIRLDRESDAVVVTMENAGLAFDNGELANMLAPYVTTKTQGSGLGLAMVDRIARAHGGSLELTSPLPGEINIRLIFPLQGSI